MNKEEKDLLLRDLCARLPYDVIVVDHYGFVVLFTWKQMKDFEDGYISKPYLRPLSSMTEEEIKEYEGFIIHRKHINAQRQEWDIDCFSFNNVPRLIDWLNAHHFDYQGLIDKGLAIEVTANNNPYKE